MTLRIYGLRYLFLPLIPAITLLIGSFLAHLSGTRNPDVRGDMGVVFAVSAAGPILVAVALRIIAPGFDLILVSVSVMLTSIGATTLILLALSSGSNQPFYGDIALRHGVFIGVGFVAMVAGAAVAHRVDQIRMYPFSLLALALLLTIVTVAFGETINGARLWLKLGPVQFQPSELARLLLAGFVASYLYDRRHLISVPWRVSAIELPPAPYLFPLIGAVLSAVSVLVFQNDLGMAGLVVLGAFAAVAGMVRSTFSFVAASTCLAAAALASFYATPRVRDRVAGWLDPWSDPVGFGFQFVQADFTLAAGGLFGYQKTAQAPSIPEIHTDFILVAVGTEFGWIGAIAVLALSSVLVCRCALAVLSARDGFRSLLAFSLTALIGIQVVLIAGGTLRVLPLTGLTFPLLSYGGTSMVATMFTIGIIAGLGAPQTKRQGFWGS